MFFSAATNAGAKPFVVLVKTWPWLCKPPRWEVHEKHMAAMKKGPLVEGI